MTLREAYLACKNQLWGTGIESSSFDSICLFQKVFGMDRTGLAVHGGDEADDDRAKQLLAMAARRAEGYPLQYLLGEWPFMGLDFYVGPGVLIPREETELLVMAALREAEKKPKGLAVLDLCAGSGAVGIAIAKRCSQARITAVELSPQAMSYLNRNKERHQVSVEVLCADVLSDASSTLPKQDVVVSNPPYLTEEDMTKLQREVTFEPELALRGGKDGLVFYRAIAKKWLPLLKPGGLLAVECGMGQDRDIINLFTRAGLTGCGVLPDFNEIGRVVTGRKPEKDAEI